MTLTPLHFLIVCPLIFIAGFIDSIAGGGGLISLPAYLISGLPVHTCIATNKLSSSMGTVISTGRYVRAGYVDLRLSVFCVAAALVGASLGANLALMIDDTLFRMLMLVILPLTAFYVLRKKDLFAGSQRDDLPFARLAALASVIAFVLGMYDGFYGPGTGTFLILVFTGLAHMSLSSANGIAKVINWVTNITSMAVFLTNGRVLLPLGLTAGCFSIAGSYIGTRFFDSRGAKIVRPVMIGVLIIFFIKVILELV